MLLIETNGFEKIFLYWVFFLLLGKKSCISFSKALENISSNSVIKSFLEFMLVQLLKGQSEICSKLLAYRCSINFPSFFLSVDLCC